MSDIRPRKTLKVCPIPSPDRTESRRYRFVITRFRSQIVAVFVLISCTFAIEAAPPERVPVPADDVQKKVETDVRALYRTEYSKKSAADLKALAAKLFQLGLETKGDPASRFVLFREAKDLAAKAADPVQMLKAITQLGTEFQVDELALKTDSLETAGRAAAIPSAQRAVAVAALSTTDEAVRVDRYDEAVRLSALAARAAPKSKDEPLLKKAGAREKEIREIAVGYELMKPSEAKLKIDPKNDAAARVVGRFRCLLKGDWEAGLPLLAQSADGKLKEVIRQDLASPKLAEERRAVADGYWELSDGEKGTVARQLRLRACHFYRLALPDLGGLALERAKRRVDEFEPPGPWDHLDIGNAEVIDDFIRMSPSMIQTKESFTGPVEMRVVVRLPANDIRLAGPSGSSVIFNWGDNPQELRLHRPDGNTNEEKLGSLMKAPIQALKFNTWYKLRWRLTASECTVWVDEKIVLSEKGKYTLTSKEPMRFFAIPAGVDVKSFTVRSVK